MKLIGECTRGERGWKSARTFGPSALTATLSLALVLAGCSSGSSSKTSTPAAEPSQLYFTAGLGSGSIATYAIDHTAQTFTRSTYGVTGASVSDSGNLSTLTNGALSLDPTFISGNSGPAVLQTPPPASYSVELPGQAALIELATPAETTDEGDSIPAENFFAPGVPTNTCPNLTTATTFQFVTIPKPPPNGANSGNINPAFWNPALETAYGSVEIATSATTVKFSSVSQYTLPAANGGAPGSPSFPAPATASAACATTYFGQVMSVPELDTVTGNGSGPPSATVGIGPSGFLVEDAGSGKADPTTGLTYENFLGAAYGAIGVPAPASDITTSLTGGQYLGFLYAPGSANGFSLISSFAGASQASCTAFLGQLTAAHLQPSANTIYGGEFAGNDPSTNPTSNCDVAIDLGTQQGGSNNGLYLKAAVYVGGSFPENGNGAVYSFPVVVVAGQLNGKNAIFLIGADTTGMPTRSWGIYLLQSN